MATQYSNKPIVTNGLVYALDFGNQKSYVSGSTSARSLKFGSVTGSILTFGGASIPNLQNGLLKMVAPTSTTGSTVNTLQQFSDLIPSGDFTIQLVATFPGPDMFITQGPEATRLISTAAGMFGWYINPVPYGGGSFYKTITKNIPTGLKHITYRYSSGSYDMFVNGVPMPTVGRNSTTSTNTGTLTINGYGTLGLSLATQDLGNFYIYDRALTSDEIYSNYLIQAQRYGLPTIAKPYRLDENAYLFLSQSGITDPIITSSINTFVLGLKSASLWDKMIAIYPFVGTGSVGVNLTGSQSWNLKDPTTAFYKLAFTGSWNGSTSGSTPSGSNTSIDTGVLPYEYYPFKSDSNQHISILSYDTPTSSAMLAGTGMTREVAVSTLAGDYGTPAAAYSVRKVRTAYSGALMDVRRSIDNVTSSIGYVSNGDLDTGSLLNFANAVGENSPGSYSGLAAAYSLRRVSASYSGNAIDVRRSDNVTSSIGFDASGNLNTGSLLSFAYTENKLLYSNTLNNAAWSNAFGRITITTASAIAPDGTNTGTLLSGSYQASPNSLALSQVPIGSTSLRYTSVLYVSQSTSDYVFLRPGDNTACVYRFSTGVFTNVGPFVATLASESAANGWIKLTATTPANENYVNYYIGPTDNTSSLNYSNPISPGAVYVWGAQLNSGSTALPYIQTTTAATTSSYVTTYVTQWYDQSGNNKHATQTTASIQPLIISSGSIILNNGKPCLDARNRTSTPTGSVFFNIPSTTVQTLFGTLQPTAVDFINYYTWGTGGFWIHGNALAANMGLGGFDGTNSGFDGSGSLTQQLVYKNIRSSKLYVSKNGGTETDLGTFNPISVTQILGRQDNTYQFALNGYAQELLLYNSDQSANKPLIENNINNYYSIYTSSNAGYVARWYDQSGNNRHATVPTSANPPLIVISGSLLIQSGRPSVDFGTFANSAEGRRLLQAQFSYSDPKTILTVAKAGPGSAYRYQYVGDSPYYFNLALSNTANAYLNTSVAGVPSDYTNNTLYYAYFNGASSTLGINSGSAVSQNTVTTSDTTFTIGGVNTFNDNYWSGSIQELVFYSGDQTTNRQPISYGVNNYYNLYSGSSTSFTTSSFAIYATSGSVSASLNNDLVSGISSTGPLGFITVSRTGSNSLTIARNGVTSSFAVPASGALSTGIYLGAINNNGLALANSPLGISFASVGTGLTGNDLNNYYNLVDKFQFNLGRQRLLDMFPGATAAYSLRRLRSTYTGSAIDVQSGTVSQSIGFDAAGNLDTTTLLAFAGSGNAFVKTWYDQAGNNNFTQTNSSLQPQIVSSGSILTQTGVGTPKPAIRFNGNSQYLDCTETTVSTGDSSLFLAMQKGLGETNILATANGASYYYLSYDANQYYGSQGTGDPGRAFNVTSYGLISVTFKLGDELKFYRNNSLRITRTSPPIGAQTYNRLCGNAFGPYGAVNLNEIVIYPTNQITNRIGINSNINNYYQIY